MIRLVFLGLCACAVPAKELVAEECERVSVGDSISSLDAREATSCCVYKYGPITDYAGESSHEAGPAVELECCAAGRAGPSSCAAHATCERKPEVYIVGTPRTNPQGELEFKQSCCCVYAFDGVVAARHVTGTWTSTPY